MDIGYVINEFLAATVNGAMGGVASFRGVRVCFAAGTPIRTPEGSKRIEDIRRGDLVLSRDEHDPDGLVVAKVVEEVFERNGRVRELRIGGRTIRSTSEHPYSRQGDGWVPLGGIRVGDRLLGEDGRWLAVEGVRDTGESCAVRGRRVN